MLQWALSGTSFGAAFPDFVQPFIKALPLSSNSSCARDERRHAARVKLAGDSRDDGVGLGEFRRRAQDLQVAIIDTDNE